MTTTLVRAGLQYAWRGPSLLIVGDDGAADISRDPLHGFYYREARALNGIRLTANGDPLWLCECAMVRPDLLSFAYTYPEIVTPSGGGTGQSDDEEHLSPAGIPQRALDVQLLYELHVAFLRVTVAVSNRGRRHVEASLRCALDADFADLLEAQSGTREQTAAVERQASASRLSLAYQHPQLALRCDVTAVAGWNVDRDGLAAALSLAPRQTQQLVFDVVPSSADAHESLAAGAEHEAAHERWRQAFTRVEIPGNTAAGEILTNNIRDLASLPALQGAADERLAFQAGMPLYPAFFGRDAVTSGWQAAMLDRGEALDAALTRLGRVQANADDPWRDAEPGRIPYQMRTGPLAMLRLNPYSAYYADYASPLMYVISLANLFAWTGEIDRVRDHWDTARRIMDWARQRGDLDQDGYLEYQTRSPIGTKNQGWKDSGDAIVYEDGTPVPAPIATCELQGYWFAAQELMAVLCTAMGDGDTGVAYRRSAAALKERFNRDWWVADEQCVALALDPQKRQVRAVTSNVGHCLATGIIDDSHLRPVVGRLFAPDMFSGWGIRTLSSAHAYYDPVSYHRGTVWGVEQGTIVFGLRRFGFVSRAQELARAMFDLAQLYPDDRIPECIGGYGRSERPVPGAYPRANTPQLWNATAFPLVIQSLLGLMPLGPVGTLVIDPVLPEWLPSLVVRGLRVGDAAVTLSFRRRPDGATDWDVEHQRGTLRIIRQAPPESVTAGLTDRLRGLAEGLVK